MKHISILVPKGAILGSLEGTRQLFTQVNEFYKMKGMPPLFKVELVGLSEKATLTGGLFTVNTDAIIADVKKTDLIIIPAIDGDIKMALKENEDFVPWIIKHY